MAHDIRAIKRFTMQRGTVAALIIVAFAFPMQSEASERNTPTSSSHNAAPANSSASLDTIKKSCSTDEDPRQYFGTYEVRSVDSYSGSLASEQQAKTRLGHSVRVSKGVFKIWGVTFTNPSYEIECIRIPTKEGHMRSDRRQWSYFYGFGPDDRQFVKVLKIQDKASDKPPRTLEIVSTPSGIELWKMGGGWLYRLAPAKDP